MTLRKGPPINDLRSAIGQQGTHTRRGWNMTLRKEPPFNDLWSAIGQQGTHTRRGWNMILRKARPIGNELSSDTGHKGLHTMQLNPL